MKNVSMLDFKDDGSEDVTYPEVHIEEITNGWLVTLVDEEGEEYRYGYDTSCKDDMLALLRDILGA